MSWPTVSLVLHCFQFDAKAPLFFFFFSLRFLLSLWLLCEGIRESIWLEMGVFEDFCCDGVSFSVWFQCVKFGTIIEAMAWSAVFCQEAVKYYLS